MAAGLSAWVSPCLSVWVSTCLNVCLSIFLNVCLCVCLNVAGVYVPVFTCVFECLHVCLSVWRATLMKVNAWRINGCQYCVTNCTRIRTSFSWRALEVAPQWLWFPWRPIRSCTDRPHTHWNHSTNQTIHYENWQHLKGKGREQGNRETRRVFMTNHGGHGHRLSFKTRI